MLRLVLVFHTDSLKAVNGFPSPPCSAPASCPAPRHGVLKRRRRHSAQPRAHVHAELHPRSGAVRRVRVPYSPATHTSAAPAAHTLCRALDVPLPSTLQPPPSRCSSTPPSPHAQTSLAPSANTLRRLAAVGVGWLARLRHPEPVFSPCNYSRLHSQMGRVRARHTWLKHQRYWHLERGMASRGPTSNRPVGLRSRTAQPTGQFESLSCQDRRTGWKFVTVGPCSSDDESQRLVSSCYLGAHTALPRFQSTDFVRYKGN